MEIQGISGQLVRLVPADRTLHFDNAYKWLNDPEIMVTVKRNLGITRGEQEAFFQLADDRKNGQWVWAILDSEGTHVGFTSLAVNWRLRCATGGIFLGDRSAWGKGYATDALRTRMAFGFKQMGLHRLQGHTVNPIMRRVYEKVGYLYEGTERQAFWTNGRWHDSYNYAVLESDYFETLSDREQNP